MSAINMIECSTKLAHVRMQNKVIVLRMAQRAIKCSKSACRGKVVLTRNFVRQECIILLKDLWKSGLKSSDPQMSTVFSAQYYLSVM